MYLQPTFSFFRKKESEKVEPILIDESENMAVNDVEAQFAVGIRTKSPLVDNYQFFKSPRNINITIMLIYIAVVILTVGAVMMPLFVEFTRINYISSTGIFGNTLRTSTRLMIMESISIGCTLPTLSDGFLDRFTTHENKATKLTLSMWHRILFLLTFTISGVIYLSLSDFYFMPYLYIVLDRSKLIIIGAVTFYAVSNGTIMNSTRSKIILLIPVMIYAVRIVVEVYNLVYPEFQFLGRIYPSLAYLSLISFVGVQVSWYYLLWCRYRVNKSLNDEEKKEGVYMLTMLFYLIATHFVPAIVGYPDSLLDTGEKYLVGDIVVQIVCILLATVLPARFLRKVVQVTLKLVQI